MVCCIMFLRKRYKMMFGKSFRHTMLRWCGLLQEPCSIPHEPIENEQELLVRLQKEKRTVFSLAQWVGDVPCGVQELSDETDLASVLMRLSK